MPLRRRGLVFSALVVGSMAPDFEYFFGLARPVSHAFPGVITFTFPLALAVLIVFHELVKWPLISLLPRGLQARVVIPARRFRWLPATRFLLILLSVAAGIATHLVWDSFCHANGWAVEHFAPLSYSIHVLPHHTAPMFIVLQDGGTLLGALVLGISFGSWYKRAPQDKDVLLLQFSPAINAAVLSAMLVSALVLGYVNGTAWYGALLRGASQRLRFIGFLITTTTVGIVEIFGFSIIWRVFLARNLARQRLRAVSER